MADERNCTVCTRDLSALQGEAWYRSGAGQGDPSADPVSAATGYGVDSAEGQNLAVRWHTKSGGEADTRVIRRLARPGGKVGAVSLARHNAGEDGAVRVVLDDRWVERPAYDDPDTANVASGSPSSDFPESESWTVRAWLCVAPRYTDIQNALFQIDDGTGAAGNQILYRLSSRGLDTKVFQSIFYRYNASGFAVANGLARVDDGRWHCVEAVFDGATGDAAVYVDGVEDWSADGLILPYSGKGSQRWFIYPDHAAFGQLEAWDRALSLEELDRSRGELPTVDHLGLVSAFDFLEGTGTTAADLTGNTPGFSGLTSTKWVTWVHPLAAYDSGAVPFWHQWRERQVLQHAVGTAMESASGGLQLHPSESLLFWYRAGQTRRTAGGDDVMRFVKTAASVDEAGFYVRLLDSDPYQQLVVGHFRNGQAAGEVTVSQQEDDGWHWVLAVVDDGADTLTVYRDGSQVGSVSVQAFSANSSCALRLVAGDSRVKVHGPVCLWSRVVTVGEAEEVAWGRKPPIPAADPGLYLYYPLDEADGAATIRNRGSAGTSGNVTVTAALEWPGEVRVSDDADGVWLPGEITEHPPLFVELISPAVQTREVLVQCFVPSNDDLRVGHLGAWETLEAMTYGRSDGGSRRAKSRKFSRTVAGIPTAEYGRGTSSLRFQFGLLTIDHDAALHHALDRMRDEGRFVLIVDVPASYNRAFRVLRSVFGLPAANGSSQDKQLRQAWFNRDVEVEGVPIYP